MIYAKLCDCFAKLVCIALLFIFMSSSLANDSYLFFPISLCVSVCLCVCVCVEGGLSPMLRAKIQQTASGVCGAAAFRTQVKQLSEGGTAHTGTRHLGHIRAAGQEVKFRG